MTCPRGFIVVISCMVLHSVQTSYGSEIIGGKEVEPHSMPYMALLETNTPACGGTLINPSWVLTAAHCKNITKVLLGVHSINETKSKSRQVLKVKKAYPHPCYDEAEKVNDLMLLKLDKKVKKPRR
ncbi:Granzyme A [Channa argus]|uniref:trypsin n=1 Tax=Channa argus TaxID=215402 RepID=A0A6G1PZ29_CHAAH|nr:Granzyme A [Channa argus]